MLATLLLVAGGSLILVGLFMTVVGKLPGDVVFRRGNFTFFFPIVTSVVLSVLLSLLLYLFMRR